MLDSLPIPFCNHYYNTPFDEVARSLLVDYRLLSSSSSHLIIAGWLMRWLLVWWLTAAACWLLLALWLGGWL